MNLYCAVRAAQEALARGDEETARECLHLAETILADPTHAPERDDVIARCCYYTLSDGRIHCGQSEDVLFDEQLFLGVPEKRKALCQACALKNAATIEDLRIRFLSA